MALVVNTLESSMVDNMADNMVIRPAGRLVGPLKDHCPSCGGEFGWRPHPEIPDRWERDRDYIGDCPHPEQPQGFLQLGRLVAAPYSTKDRLLLAFHQLGPNGSFRRDLIPASGLSEKQLDGALRRSLKTGHILRGHQRELLPVAGSAYVYQLTWRGYAYLLTRFGISQNGAQHEEDLSNLDSWPSAYPSGYPSGPAPAAGL